MYKSVLGKINKLQKKNMFNLVTIFCACSKPEPVLPMPYVAGFLIFFKGTSTSLFTVDTLATIPPKC